MTLTLTEDPRNHAELWDNGNGPGGAGNTTRSLTHDLGLARRGLPSMVPKKPRVARVQLSCEECGARYERLPCQLTRGRGRYCSRSCRGSSMRRGDEKNCTGCGEPFYKQNSEMDSTEHFCSVLCYKEWRDENRGNTYRRIGPDHVHRIIASQTLGRALRPSEVVHHMDENKLNNDVSNLAVFPNQSYHARWHQGGMTLDELAGYTLTNGAPSL